MMGLAGGTLLWAVLMMTTGRGDITVGNDVVCPAPWTRLHRAWYHFYNRNTTMSDANVTCSRDHAHLLTINSVAEYKNIKAYIKNKTMIGMWVGLQKKGDQWTWLDGTAFNNRVTPWRNNEPNSDGNEFCVEMDSNAKFNDKECDALRPFMCEKSEVNPFGETGNERRGGEGVVGGQNGNVNTGDDGNSDNAKGSHGQDRNTDERCNFGNSSCPSVSMFGVSWPPTPQGNLSTLPCKTGSGNMTFQCDPEQPCWKGQPNVDQCASKAFRDLLNTLPLEENLAQAPDPERTLSLTSELANITRNKDVSEEDIAVTSKLIQKLVTPVAASSLGQNQAIVQNVVLNVVSTGGNLLSPDRSVVWSAMNRRDKRRSATALLVAMEKATVTLAAVLKSATTISHRDNNIELQLVVVPVTSSEGDSGNNLQYRAEGSSTTFTIPQPTLAQLTNGSMARVVFMTHYTLGSLLDDASDDVTADVMDKKVKEAAGERGGRQVASHVVSVNVVTKQNTNQLTQPVTFTIAHTKQIPPSFHPLCAFWDMSNSGVGAWSDKGCGQVSSNDSHTTCQCDHMTNFAILMDVNSVEVSEGHQLSLRVVTYVGCIISCICLLLSWLTFTCFSSLQAERNSIHKHLVVCLFLAELLFLSGVHQTEIKVLCGVVAGVMHYLFLAAFLWMLMEAVHILLMLVQVFDGARSRLPFYCAAAYGPPLLIVAVSAGVYPAGYGTDQHCWLTTDRGLIWSFAGPVAVILFVNSVALIYAMTMVCRHSDFVFTSKDKASSNVRSWIQGALALEVLLGLTWVLGFLFLSQRTVAAAYIFTILNSTQGLFIFLFHCVLNKKVRKEYSRVLQEARKSSSSTSGTQSASLRIKLSSSTSFSNKHSNPTTEPTPTPV